MNTKKANVQRTFVGAIVLALSASVFLQGCTGGGGGYRDSGPTSDNRGS